MIDGLYTRADGPPGQADERDLTDDAGAAGHWHEIRWPGHAATLQVIDVPRVLAAAERSGTTVRFTSGAGETLCEGSVIAVAGGEPDPELAGQVLHALTVGSERTFEQDPALPLRLLADIALRALSPAVNDPTTAVQALDSADSLLRAIATRDLDVGQVAGRDGKVRVSLVLPGLAGLRRRGTRRHHVAGATRAERHAANPAVAGRACRDRRPRPAARA